MAAIRGGCLCGEVRYEARAEQGGGHCFCTDCRRASGTSHGSHMIVAADDFSVDGEVRFFEKTADSGNAVRRGFCPRCGSAVYSTNAGMPGMAFVRASSLDDPEAFTPAMAVYTSRAPRWAELDPELPAFAEMPAPEQMPV